MLQNISDIRDFDAMLLRRLKGFRSKFRDWLAPHTLTFAKARVHHVLMPMVGVYTPGWQALPACAWYFVEIETHEGLVGTGEWPTELPQETRETIDQLIASPGANVLDVRLEEPLFMAWWDLVGQVLGKPLHVLWAELFERGFTPPDQVPNAAYTWARFPDMHGHDEVTFDNWPEHAKMRADQGFPAIKISMAAYEPDVYIDVIHRVREAVGPNVTVRCDPHGCWNYVEARRVMRAVDDCNLEWIEQPVSALMPQRFYPPGEPLPKRSLAEGGYQYERYFRDMTRLRREQSIPLSCHWWTPPIVHPPGASVMANQWDVNWHLLERYDAADVSSPDIGLGPWALWRTYELARFMGMHVTLHSNFEMCLQLAFRGAMASALMYDTESVGLYMGTTPRACHAIDNETIQVSDDVIEGGQFDWTGGHVRLSDKPGHGLRLDPQRLEKYTYTPEAVVPHREYAIKLYENYVLDRPHTKTLAGWPKPPGAPRRERFDRQAYPYSVNHMLGTDIDQDIDTQLNR